MSQTVPRTEFVTANVLRQPRPLAGVGCTQGLGLLIYEP